MENFRKTVYLLNELPFLTRKSILLTNWVQGLYCKLWSAFSWTSIYGLGAKNQSYGLKWKKQGGITYSSQRQWLHSSVGYLERRTGTTRSWVQTPLKSWLFQASVRNCLNCAHNCDDHSLLDNLHYLDWENKFSIMFMISLGNWIELESTLQSQSVRTLEYRALTQTITAHLVPERDIINSGLLWKAPCQQDWEQL